MITRDEFDTLPPREKAYTLFDLGDEIDSRTENDATIKLYMVGDFFVELWFSGSPVKIVNLLSLSEDEVIEKYFSRIDISGVFNL